MMPYLIASDLHAHAWSTFAQIDPATGINSRLLIILNELRRAAHALQHIGGRVIVLAGDLFHTRGELMPSVLNPVCDVFDELRDAGFDVYAIPGNHDLEEKVSTRLGSAITALESHGVIVCSDVRHVDFNGTHLLLVPWQEDVADILRIGQEYGDEQTRRRTDMIIHAPVDSVLSNIPSHGLTSDLLAMLGFRNVFAGHYHHHKEFPGKVFSIGATTHQKWSDVDTKAGFVIVHPDGTAEHRESQAPKFVTLPTNIPVDQLIDQVMVAEWSSQMVVGNYVRCFVEAEPPQVDALKARLLERGALAAIVEPVARAATSTREGVQAVTETTTNEAAIAQFIDDKDFKNKPALVGLCNEILTEVRQMELRD